MYMYDYSSEIKPFIKNLFVFISLAYPQTYKAYGGNYEL